MKAKKDTKQLLFENMAKINPSFKPINEIVFDDVSLNSVKTGGESFEKIKRDFPGHARSVNPIDSPQYKWYKEVYNFMQGEYNNVFEKAELVKFFQNNFIGMDYDVLQTPAEAVSWWLSPEHQEFIMGEMNTPETNDEVSEAPMFGGQQVSQDQYDELQYDKSTMEKAMSDAFKTPEGYQMKHPVKGGESIQLKDGDVVKVMGVDQATGNIKVRVVVADEESKKYYKNGYFDIMWTPVQFDAIVGSEPINEDSKGSKQNIQNGDESVNKLAENRRIQKDKKTMLFENFAKLNPDLKLNKKGTLTKKRLNEYNNYDYPAGADADPNAPWHQNDEVDEYDDWDLDKNDDIILNSQHGGTHSVDWEFLVGDNEQELDAIMNQINTNPKDPELKIKIDALVDQYLKSPHGQNFDWEYQDPGYEGPDPSDRDMYENQEQGVKYRADVAGIRENTWSTNAKEYDTEEEAKAALDNLASRWFGFDLSRVVPSTTPRNQPIDMQNDVIYQNMRR